MACSCVTSFSPSQSDAGMPGWSVWSRHVLYNLVQDADFHPGRTCRPDTPLSHVPWWEFSHRHGSFVNGVSPCIFITPAFDLKYLDTRKYHCPDGTSHMKMSKGTESRWSPLG
jgi:hypothetical protein